MALLGVIIKIPMSGFVDADIELGDTRAVAEALARSKQG